MFQIPKKFYLYLPLGKNFAGHSFVAKNEHIIKVEQVIT